jgi:hypothetical protein
MRYQCLHTSVCMMCICIAGLRLHTTTTSGSTSGWRLAVWGKGEGSDAGAASCLDEANHWRTLAQGKAQSMRSSMCSQKPFSSLHW